MGTIGAPGSGTGAASALRRLYFGRFAFAVVWALVVFAATKETTPVAGVLLVIYPLFDVGAVVVDASAWHERRSPVLLYVSMAVSLLAAFSLLASISVGIAAMSGTPALLRVWGVWGIVTGLVQLIVVVSRRRLSGLWPTILSGGISVLAGASFVASAGAANPTLAGAAGYAVPGGIFFVFAALELGRATKRKLT